MSNSISGLSDLSACPDGSAVLVGELLPGFLDHLPHGIAFCGLLYEAGHPSDGVYLYTNPAFRRQTGLGPGDGTCPGGRDPGLRASLPELFESSVRVASGGPSESFEAFLERPQRWLSFQVSGSKPGHFFIVANDITEHKRTNAALAESEQRYRAVLEDQTEVICRLKADGTILYVNEAYCRYFGQSRDALIGRTWHPVAWPEDIPHINAQLDSLSPGHPVVVIENRVIVGGGEVRWAQFVNRAFFDERGRLVEMQSIGRDITERKRAEAALRRNEALNRKILRALPAEIAVVDRRGRIMAVNDAWTAFAARAEADAPPQAAAGANYLEVCRRSARGGEEDAGRALAGIESVLADRRARFAMEYFCDTPQGPLWFLMTVAPLGPMAEDGAVISHHDITARKRAEEALRKSEKRFRAIFENAATGIAFSDLDGLIQECNPAFCRLTGYTEGELIRTRLSDLIHPEDRAASLSGLQRLLAGERPSLEIENRYLRNNGEPVWVRKFISLLRDPSGNPAHWLVLVTDMTERRRIEAALRDADRQKDEFLATLAHELRNPLAPLRNGLQILRLAGDKPAIQAHALAMMERQLGHMVRLIDDLLDLSRIARGKIELHTAPIELAAVAQHALETCRPLISQRGHVLRFEAPPEPILVDGDLIRLAQVVANLLNNAAKYTPSGGRITLAVERQGREAVVRVRDTGIGIPAPMLGKVFDLFAQVDQSLESSQGGLGIGLSLAKRLVELHGGTLEARSEGPGQGSEFVARLPALGAPAAGLPGALHLPTEPYVNRT